MSDIVSDSSLRDRLSAIQERLRAGLPRVDPHHRLQGRPITHRVVAGQTFVIEFREVPRIDESEVLGVKRLIGDRCYCQVTPQTAETLSVKFVIPLTG